MIRPTLIDLNAVDLNHYQFMISLDNGNGICDAVDNLSAKMGIPSETKDVNVKVLNTIATINEAKHW